MCAIMYLARVVSVCRVLLCRALSRMPCLTQYPTVLSRCVVSCYVMCVCLLLCHVCLSCLAMSCVCVSCYVMCATEAAILVSLLCARVFCGGALGTDVVHQAACRASHNNAQVPCHPRPTALPHCLCLGLSLGVCGSDRVVVWWPLTLDSCRTCAEALGCGACGYQTSSGNTLPLLLIVL